MYECKPLPVLFFITSAQITLRSTLAQGLTLSTCQLNVSALCRIGVAFRGCFGGVLGVSEGTRGCLG